MVFDLRHGELLLPLHVLAVGRVAHGLEWCHGGAKKVGIRRGGGSYSGVKWWGSGVGVAVSTS
jgi:hypothetical protein